MPKRKASQLIFSLALAFAVLAPQAALGGRLSDATANVASAPAAPAVGRVETKASDASDTADATDETADDAGRPKRKGNAFARALAAPFRALARLFGGGGKSNNETVKKPAAPAPSQEAATVAPESKSAPESAQAVEPARNMAAGESKADDAAVQSSAQAAATAQPAAVEAARVEPIVKPAAARETAAAPRDSAGVVQPAEGARIIRPSDGEVARELQPKMWIPLIVGVPADPVSQGRALLQHGYIQEAIAELQTATTTSLPEQLAEANNLLGLAYDRLGWHRQAAEAYERALMASPKDHVALTNLGYSLYLADDYVGALKRLKQAAKLAPTEPVIFNNLGVVNARLGRYDDAYKNFARGSGEYEGHLKLAGILEDQRRDKEAVKHYEAALRIQPGASAILERLVTLYERTGARDKADTARRALGQPRNPQKTATGGGG